MQECAPMRRLVSSIALMTMITSTIAPTAMAQGSAPPPAGPARPTPPPATPKAGAPKPSQDAGAPTAAAPAATSAPASEAPAAEGSTEAGAPPAPPTEEQKETARTAFEAAQKAYDEGDYVTAYEQFKVAHQTIPSPHAEYWMAKSLDQQGGKEAEAALAYETFLSNPGAQHVGEDKVAESQARLTELKAGLPAQLTVVTTPPGATVTIDGTVQPGVTPLTVDLQPGAHKIEAELEGHDPAMVEVALEGGARLEQQIALAAAAPPPAPAAEATLPPPPPPETEERSMIPAYVTLGLAGAGAVVGTIFGIQALSDKGDYDDNPTTDKADDVERNALIADMAFGVALTLGITGVVLLTADDGSEEAPAEAASKKRLVVAPYVGPKSGGAAARFTF